MASVEAPTVQLMSLQPVRQSKYILMDIHHLKIEWRADKLAHFAPNKRNIFSYKTRPLFEGEHCCNIIIWVRGSVVLANIPSGVIS